MSGLKDARPDSVDVLFRPGDPYEHTLNWPAGELAGRTFTSTLNGVALTVGIVGDVMTVDATGTQTNLPVGVEVEWQLLEDLGGGVTPVVLLGVWTPDNGPRAVSSGATTVVVNGGTVTVEVPGTGATLALAARVTATESDIDDLETADSAHFADDTAHGNPLAVIATHELDLTAHGLGITHDWGEDGWAPFTASVMTDAAIVNGAPQTFTTTVVAGAGVVTGTQPAPAVDHRVAYLRDGTEWEDSEITSLIYGPGAGVVWSGANAQQGHLHQVQETAPGVMTGIAIWSSVAFGLDYSFLHGKLVDWNAAVLGQAATTIDSGSDSPFIDRRLSIINRQRVTAFGLFFNEHRVHPQHLYGLKNGDIVTVDSTDATFDETQVAVNGSNTSQGMVQVSESTTLSTSPLAVDFGTITPSGGTSQKRWTPYWLSTRVRTVNATTKAVELKRWRPEDPEPDWSDPRVRRGNLVADGAVETMPTGPGHCALWAAHFFGGSHAAFGTCRFRELT